MILAGKRILVVEDDVANMAVISMLLKQHGAAVIQDPWNSATISRIRQMKPIDLILMDLMLRHGESGFDIFTQIQAEPDLAEIPVVVVSASDPGLMMNKARQMGFMGYIEKPISYREFAGQILQVLRGYPVWGEISDSPQPGYGGQVGSLLT